MSVADIIKSLPGKPSDLARALKVSDGTVSDWRRGRRTPTVEKAALIEAATGVYGIVAAVVQQRLDPKSREAA